MPLLSSRAAFEIGRGTRVFLNLDAGVSRGEVPDLEQKPGQEQGQVEKRDRRLQRTLQQTRKQLSDKDRALESARQELADRDQEIARLQKLNSRQATDMDRKTAELNRSLYEGGQVGEANGEARRLAVPDGSMAGPYLDLMKQCLTDSIYGEDRGRVARGSLPAVAHTLIGLERLDNLQSCTEDVLANEVPGDLIETGVWRGGATIFMRAVLRAYGVEDRRVWVADSFEGFPPPDAEKYPRDEGDRSYTIATADIAPSLEQVQANFERYGLLDDQVRFLKGWFRDTLPEAPVQELAVVRLDGDMYESTMDALVNLYPRLSVGGYLIVDDYGRFPACRQAVHDYREFHGIGENIQPVDWSAAFWQRLE